MSASLIHALPGRIRLRVPWLRRHRDRAEALADELAALAGVIEVQLRPRTGSVLCRHDPARHLDPVHVLSLVEKRAPPDDEVSGRPQIEGSRLARAFASFFKGVNADVIVATDGRVDLGTLAALGFLGTSVAEVVTTRKLKLPPWSQLAWWAFRTFTTVEKQAIESAEIELPA